MTHVFISQKHYCTGDTWLRDGLVTQVVDHINSGAPDFGKLHVPFDDEDDEKCDIEYAYVYHNQEPCLFIMDVDQYSNMEDALYDGFMYCDEVNRPPEKK
jgi:hypothetical protein